MGKYETFFKKNQDQTKFICKLCGKQLTAIKDCGTSHLRYHIRIVHKAQFANNEIKVRADDPLSKATASSANLVTNMRKRRLQETDASESDLQEMNAVVLMGLAPDGDDFKPPTQNLLSPSPITTLISETPENSDISIGETSLECPDSSISLLSASSSTSGPEPERRENSVSVNNLACNKNNCSQKETKKNNDLLSAYIDNSYIAMANLTKLRLGSSENAVKVIRRMQSLLDEELNKYSPE